MARHVAQIDPLRLGLSIVDKNGGPTPLFMRAFNALFRNTTTQGQVTITTDDTLTGGGALADDITLGIDTTTEAERIRDVMGVALVPGANITITPNDALDTITIAATGGGWIPLVDGAEPPTFITDGAGVLLLVAGP